MTSNKIFNQSMQEMRTLITNATEQAEVKAMIAPHGYTDEKMLALSNLLKETEELANIQAGEYLQKKNASNDYTDSCVLAEKNYAKLRKICKYKLEPDSQHWSDLELSSAIPRTAAAEIAYYQKFYSRLLSKTNLLTELAPFGFTSELITAQKEQLDQLKTLYDIRENESGEAQRATKLRDEKFNELKNECKKLKQLLKIVFDGADAQLLESLGILVRS